MLDRSDLHAVVSRLEADGLVERSQDPADRRRNVVALTRNGRTTLRRLERRVVAVQDELTASLSAKERAQLVALLKRVAGA
jgi:DNA-binding MarR family transcriptional regulator